MFFRGIINGSHNMNISQTTKRRVMEKKARREAILSVTRKVFFTKGFMGATMDEIAQKCQLAKGTIYLYFQSKEELYVSLMVEGFQLLRKEMGKIESLQLESDEILEALAEGYYEFYREKKGYFEIMFLSHQPDIHTRVSDELLAKCINEGRACLETVSNVIQKGIDTGLFRKIDPWTVANILWGMLNGIIINYEKDPVYREEIVGIELKELLKTGVYILLEGLKIM